MSNYEPRPCACRFVGDELKGENEQVEWCVRHAAARDALELKDEMIQAMESVLAKIGERLKVPAGDVPALFEVIDQLTAGDSAPDDGEKQAATLSEIDR